MLTSTAAVITTVAGASASGPNDPTGDSAPPTSIPPVDLTDVVGLPGELARAGLAEAVMWVGDEGMPTSFVAADFVTSTDDPETAAWGYLHAAAELYGVADPDARFSVLTVTPSAAGTVVRFEQSLGELPVYDGEFTVTVVAADTDALADSGPTDDAGLIVAAVNGIVLADAELAAPVLDADAALARAGELEPSRAPEPASLRAVAFSPLLGDMFDALLADAGEDGQAVAAVPAWEVVIVGDDPLDDQIVVISALDGALLDDDWLTSEVESWDVYEARVERFAGKPWLVDRQFVIQTRGPFTQTFEPVSADATTAHQHARTVWSYFDQEHGRHGFDGAGGTCTMYIVPDQFRGTAYYNKHYDDGCRLVFGTWGGVTSASLDVVAHEFTHGVVATTAGLKYKFQSGALNEHYADFFALMIDTSDWRISTDAAVLRNPQTPVDMSSFVVVDERANKDNDRGGVHTNSAIPNHAGYIVASTIGRDKAAQIWYATLLKLNKKSGFGEWACATIGTAKQLRRSGQLTREELIVVEDAMLDVGLLTFAGLSPETRSGARRGEVQLCHAARRSSGADAAECAAAAADPTVPDCRPLIASGSGGTGGPGGNPSDVPPDDDGDNAATTTAPPTTVAAGPEPCFVGMWELDSQDFIDQIIAYADSDFPPGASFEHVGGRYVVTAFADGTTHDRREEWTWGTSMDGITIHLIFDGLETGTWELEHGDDPTHGVAHLQTTGGEITIRLDSSIGALPMGQQTFAADALGASVTYACTPTTLEMTTVQDGHTITTHWNSVTE